MMRDAFLKVVLTDGVDVQRVLHVGRKKPVELRTALELGPPPAFAGVACSEAGCERRYGLEWDHIIPVVAGGPTSIDNSQPLCSSHHREKTQRDRAAGLLASQDETDTTREREGSGGAGEDDRGGRAPP